ncbi:unnamed protein product [Caenorhabditis auriculariae]|uniref:Uncharacterized protein n=1 Tax=Caenorhabditis auriculariae TaxID=2777116 RepID=A0A8S1HCM0_9PELO|nr:unnamed protein product [Caenorhabditis auriculariae]
MPEETEAYYKSRFNSLDVEMTELFQENEQLNEDLDNIDRQIDEEPTPALYREKRRLEEAIEAIDASIESVFAKMEDNRNKLEAFKKRQADKEAVNREPDVVTDSSSAAEASPLSESLSDTDSDGF